MESTIQYNPDKRDASDPEIELRAHARQIAAGQLLARNSDSAAAGLQTDADARQTADSQVGRWPVGLSPRGDPAATPPSAAAEASAAWRGQTEHSTLYPTTTDAYYGPHPSVSGAEIVDQSSAAGSEWDRFVGQIPRGLSPRELSHQLGMRTPRQRRGPIQARLPLSRPQV